MADSPGANQPAHQRAVCPLCETAAARTLLVARDRLLGGPETYPVVRCLGCGLVYLRPRPTPETLARAYPATYYPLDADPSHEARAAAQALLARVTAWRPARGPERPRLLDVGCGTGLFLHLARQAGMRVQGIELSDSAASYARTRYGLAVETGTLADATLPAKSFDVVTMWHVLEHLPDPAAALRRVRDLLAPGGLLLLAVPNIASLEARLFGRRWYSLDAPRHLYHFAPQTLATALGMAGLRADRVIHSPGTAGLVYSIMGDLTGISLRLRGRPLAASAYLRTANVLHTTLAPVCAGLARCGRGGALEVYAVEASEGRDTQPTRQALCTLARWLTIIALRR